MKKVKALSRQQMLWIGIGLCLAAAFLLLQVKGALARKLSTLKKEYYLSLVLSDQREERAKIYESVLKAASLPQQGKLDENSWIQKTQSLVASKQLALEELRPDSGQDYLGRRQTEIDLTVEGKMSDFLAFLRAVTEAEDYVYVRHFLISTSSDKAESVRVQMTLAQA